MTVSTRSRFLILVAAIALIAMTAPATGDWLQWRQSADHSGQTPLPTPILAPHGAWTHTAEDFPVASPAVAPIDGEPRIFAATYPEQEGGAGSVIALDRFGQEIWSQTPSPLTTGGFVSSPAVLEDEGGHAVIAGKAEDSTLYRYNATTGDEEASWQMGNPNEDVIVSSPTLHDVTQDGTPEIILGGSQPGQEGSLFVLSSTLEVLFEHEVNAPIWSSPLVADLDGDGHREIVASTGVPDAGCIVFGTLHPTNTPKTGDDEGRIYVFEHTDDWTKRWEKPLQGPTMSSPAIGDLTGDGSPEVTVGSQGPRGSCTDPTKIQTEGHLSVFTSQGDPLATEQDSLILSVTTPVIHDLEDDGTPEIFHGTATGLRGWAYNGTTIEETRTVSILEDDRHSNDHWVLASPLVVDIDKDGNRSLVALTIPVDINEQSPLESEVKPGALFAVTPGTPSDADLTHGPLTFQADGFIPRWAHPTQDGGLSGPISADATSNGRGEILFGTGFPVIGNSTDLWMIIPGNPIVEEITNTPESPSTLDDITLDAKIAYPTGDESDLDTMWELGDGNTSTEDQPVHSYDEPGTYLVTAIVTDPDGNAWEETRELKIENLSPEAGFDHTPQVPDPGETVDFHDESDSTDSPLVEWAWEMGDGTTYRSTDPDQAAPDHAYDEAGTYTVCLTVTDDFGAQDTACKDLRVNAPPTASFTTEPQHQEPRVDDPLPFVDESHDPDGAIQAWYWDFGDGNTSTLENPEYTYADNKTYEVTLTVTDDDGATSTVTDSVTVYNWPPDAAFGHDPALPDPGDLIQFLDESTHPQSPEIQVETWYWDLGDGNTSTEREPEHAYEQEGAYKVTLTVEDGEGRTDTITETLYVGFQPPQADFDTDTQVPVEETASFDDESYHPDEGSQIEAWHWDFRDGNTSTEPSPEHTYGEVGTYEVTLTVTDSNGLTDTATRSLDVLPVAQATVTPSPANLGRTVRLDSTITKAPGTEVTNTTWTDQQGNEISEDSVLEGSFSEPGEHCRVLSIQTIEGLTDEETVCITATDELNAFVFMTEDAYEATEPAKGTVLAHFANGYLATGTTFEVTVQYRSGHPTLDSLLEDRDCLTWSTTVESGPSGLGSFEVPPAFLERCQDQRGILELITTPAGRYDVAAHGSWQKNAGSAMGGYRVTPFS